MAVLNILWPTFALVALIFVVWFTLFFQRMAHMRRNPPRRDDFADGEAALRYFRPVEMPANNLANLFEVPVLYFALVPLNSLPTAQRKGAKDGEKFVEIDLDIELSALEKIRLVQSSDPQVELFTSGDSEESTATIEFACDTGSTLFRNALRQAIWGLGSFRSLLSRWDR